MQVFRHGWMLVIYSRTLVVSLSHVRAVTYIYINMHVVSIDRGNDYN
jgi:hypothetical protein